MSSFFAEWPCSWIHDVNEVHAAAGRVERLHRRPGNLKPWIILSDFLTSEAIDSGGKKICTCVYYVFHTNVLLPRQRFEEHLGAWGFGRFQL